MIKDNNVKTITLEADRIPLNQQTNQNTQSTTNANPTDSTGTTNSTTIPQQHTTDTTTTPSQQHTTGRQTH